jgi:hypothetical protein
MYIFSGFLRPSAPSAQFAPFPTVKSPCRIESFGVFGAGKHVLFAVAAYSHSFTRLLQGLSLLVTASSFSKGQAASRKSQHADRAAHYCATPALRSAQAAFHCASFVARQVAVFSLF